MERESEKQIYSDSLSARVEEGLGVVIELVKVRDMMRKISEYQG
jgi:hypothetical protein